MKEHPWTTASELRRLPVLLLYPIQIYMSVLITNMVLTAWGPSHLSQNTTFGENLIKVAIFNIRKRGLWNVKCNSHQTWYMFIYNLIYQLIIGRGVKNVSYIFVILQTTKSNTSEYQQKQAKCQNFQTTKLCTNQI